MCVCELTAALKCCEQAALRPAAPFHFAEQAHCKSSCALCSPVQPMAELPLPGACGVAISADEGLVAAWTEAEVHVFTLHSLLHDVSQLHRQVWSVTGAVQVTPSVTSQGSNAHMGNLSHDGTSAAQL